MADTQSGITRDGLDAIRSASARLGPGGPGAHIFVEFREDRRAVLDTSGARESVLTRLSGATVRRTVAGPSDFLCDPGPATLSYLTGPAVGAVPLSREETPIFQVPARTADPFRILERALDGALRERPGGSRLFATARWVAFDQVVAVGRGDGVLVTDRRQGSRIRLDVSLAAGARESTATVERVVRGGGDDDIVTAGTEAARRAAVRLAASKVPSGALATVFEPGVGGVVLHEIVGHALEADTVERGASSLARGERVAPRGVSITDDPRRGRGAWRFDDEGNAARATLLLAEGRVVGRLYDQRTASVAGVATTGHGRRASFRDPVQPRMGCTFLVTGSSDRDELIAGVRHGVLVRRIDALSSDPASGTAVFRVTDADGVTHGRVSEPLLPFVLHVRTIDALASLDAVADDLAFDACIGTCLRDGQPVPTSVGAPTFRIGVVRVSS